MHSLKLLAAGALLLASAGAASAVDIPPAGAASCSGCHPMTRWTTSLMVRLTGRNADDITRVMQEFRAGKRPATIMDRIAKGFTDDEIKAISAWYAAQKE